MTFHDDAAKSAALRIKNEVLALSVFGAPTLPEGWTKEMEEPPQGDGGGVFPESER